jgi:anti-sigma factor RsiW
MSTHEKQLIAFLAGDLDADAGRAFDSHLLSCESCWTAVKADRAARHLLEASREVPPTGLADRVRLAIEFEARQPTRKRRPSLAVGAAATAIASGLAAIIVILTQTAPTAPAAVAAVVASAKGLPAASGPVNPGTAPTQIGSRTSVSARGQIIQVSYYGFGSAEASAMSHLTPLFDLARRKEGVLSTLQR